MVSEHPAPDLPEDTADARRIIDEELNRLPEKYRLPIVLCELEGLTLDEAARRLRELGERAAGALREALKSNPSLEKQRRVEGLLKTLEVPPSGELLRQLRAVAAVERMGTHDAEAFLRELAGGDPTARLTLEARAARERLARRFASKT